MKHLQKISQFLYFQLCAVFFLLIYLHNMYLYGENTSFMYVFFTLLLIPIFDEIFSGVFTKIQVFHTKNHKFLISLALYILAILCLVFSGYASLITLLTITLVVSCYNKIDGRIYFLGALIVFLYVMLSLLLGNSAGAENLSIGAYYLLIAGVIGQIFENISLPKSSSHA